MPNLSVGKRLFFPQGGTRREGRANQRRFAVVPSSRRGVVPPIRRTKDWALP